MNNICRIIGMDPGNESSGLCILDSDMIKGAFNVSNENIFGKIQNYLIHPNCTIALEDIRPYSLRLTPQVISTAKFIGEAVYRLKINAGCNLVLVARNEVKKWVFDTFPEVCIPLIEKKILKRGQDRKPSFVYVDDKMVTESMKVLFNIMKPKPGSGYEYGLQSHSWQALAVAAYLQKQKKPV